ncbi:hypothetical protein [Pseudoteredinibacter isoporae]|uniref:hypothetical protein n=1 Tax=Pseudoteredinibacter isoporae TaxID=570281 RepID=UPI003108CD66
MDDKQLQFLLGRRALNQAATKDYTDWAEALLYSNPNSENAEILASMGYERDPLTEEIEKYFLATLNDLKFNIPSNEQCIGDYVRLVCTQIISGEIDAIRGTELLEITYEKSDYTGLYSIWYGATEDIRNVRDYGEEVGFYNTGLTKDNLPSYLKSIAQQFLTLLDIELPGEFFNLSICLQCKHVSKPSFVRHEKPWLPAVIYRLIYNTQPAVRPVCPNCNADFPGMMQDFKAREMYLNTYHNTTQKPPL